jgi:hypothetical protein
MGFKISDKHELNKNIIIIIIIIIIQRRKYNKELGKNTYEKQDDVILKGEKRKVHSK